MITEADSCVNVENTCSSKYAFIFIIAQRNEFSQGISLLIDDRSRAKRNPRRLALALFKPSDSQLCARDFFRHFHISHSSCTLLEANTSSRYLINVDIIDIISIARRNPLRYRIFARNRKMRKREREREESGPGKIGRRLRRGTGGSRRTDGWERAARTLSRSKTTAISEGQSARRQASERARNLRATWIQAAFNPTLEPTIMKLGLG